MQRPSTLETRPVLASEHVAKRPVFLPEFGKFLVGLRELRRWKQSHAAHVAQQRGLTALTRQVLLRLEGGMTKHPEPEVLDALSGLYDVPVEELTARYLKESLGLDLLRHSGGYRSEQGDSDASHRDSQIGTEPAGAREPNSRKAANAPTRVYEELDRLRAENAALKRRLSEIGRVFLGVSDTAGESPADLRLAPKKPRVRDRDRTRNKRS